eukprot:GHVH01007827.1.p1 GENE.GHVH01007827.1~~GHVH01007827.1.p1  ORF type:complete len:481 (-),score=87.05 GHVH01007827.1:146-1588(-)
MSDDHKTPRGSTEDHLVQVLRADYEVETGSCSEDDDEYTEVDYSDPIDPSEDFDMFNLGDEDAEVNPTSVETPVKKSKRVKRSTLKKRQREDGLGNGVDSVVRKRLKTCGKMVTELDKAVVSSDTEGYYVPVLNELINDRYRVLSGAIGKGVFSNVIYATDETTNLKVAIKMIRSNDMMKTEALKEVNVLKTLNSRDPDDRRHVIRLYEVLTHKNHMCLVFESMWANLRVALKKFGNRHGLNPNAVHSYSRQLFLALRHMKRCKLIHADLKLDNILINDTHNVLKVADLGSALAVDDVEETELLVSRFYRAPEVILGHKYDTQIDVWAAACSVFEIATGDVLFKGHSNNDMLKKFIELKGKMNSKFVKAGKFSSNHFDSEGNLLWEDKDPYTKKEVIRVIRDNTPIRSLNEPLLQKNVWFKEFSRKLTPQQLGQLKEKHRQLADFLNQCLVYDPRKRLTPEEALQHPYLRTSMSCELIAK